MSFNEKCEKLVRMCDPVPENLGVMALQLFRLYGWDEAQDSNSVRHKQQAAQGLSVQELRAHG